MDYEKLHKDTITKLQEMVNSGKITAEIARGICADFVSESEGKRIRKDIIVLIKDWWDRVNKDNISTKEQMLAWLEKQESVGEIVSRCKTSWYNEGKIAGMAEGLTDDEKYQQGWHDALEKQGETFTKKDVDDAYLKGVTNTKNEIEKQYEANYQIRKDIATFIFNHRGDIKDRAKWMDYLGVKISFVENQDEQKHVDEITSNPDYVGPKDKALFKIATVLSQHEDKDGSPLEEIKSILVDYGINNLESNEQKSADKVEPKFKVGDWVVYDGWTTQIKEVYEDGYSNIHQGFISKKHEEEMHLWTIEDAKDGDVLAAEPIEGYHSPFITIYKKKDEEDFDSYCFIGFDGWFYEEENGHFTDNIHPATKEQYNILIKAMTCAGYIFDFEKKELRKIEKNFAWSEDDIYKVQRICKYLEKIEKYYIDTTEIRECINWLKSLKPHL